MKFHILVENGDGIKDLRVLVVHHTTNIISLAE